MLPTLQAAPVELSHVVTWATTKKSGICQLAQKDNVVIQNDISSKQTVHART